MKKNRIKKFFSAILVLCMVVSGNTIAFASTDIDNSDLYESYERVINTAEEYGVPIDLSFEEYAENYTPAYGSYTNYANAYIGVFEQPTDQPKSSGGDKYYYDTGTSCPAEATYDTYNLLDVVQKGDVIYEAAGGFGITGHIAIVEGIYSRSNGGKYIRIVEAGSFGVARSILDDTRYDEKKVTVLRVSGASTANKNAAVAFCVSQLGKGYFIDFKKDTSADEKDWYCSELVWAGYKNQGIDIEVSSLGEPGVTPRDILNSSLTYSVAVTKQ